MWLVDVFVCLTIAVVLRKMPVSPTYCQRIYYVLVIGFCVQRTHRLVTTSTAVDTSQGIGHLYDIQRLPRC